MWNMGSVWIGAGLGWMPGPACFHRASLCQGKVDSVPWGLHGELCSCFFWFFFYSWWETGLLTEFGGTQIQFPLYSLSNRGHEVLSFNDLINSLPLTGPWLPVIDGKSLHFCLEFSCTLDLGVKINSINLFILSPNFSLFDVLAWTGFVPLSCMSCLGLLYLSF